MSFNSVSVWTQGWGFGGWVHAAHGWGNVADAALEEAVEDFLLDGTGLGTEGEAHNLRAPSLLLRYPEIDLSDYPEWPSNAFTLEGPALVGFRSSEAEEPSGTTIEAVARRGPTVVGAGEPSTPESSGSSGAARVARGPTVVGSSPTPAGAQLGAVGTAVTKPGPRVEGAGPVPEEGESSPAGSAVVHPGPKVTGKKGS